MIRELLPGLSYFQTRRLIKRTELWSKEGIADLPPNLIVPSEPQFGWKGHIERER